MIALVTGGGGFLGGAIVRRLVGRGDQVRSLSRHHYPELAALGVEQRLGELVDRSDRVRSLSPHHDSGPAASGVEQSPGQKDQEKMRRFIDVAREAASH